MKRKFVEYKYRDLQAEGYKKISIPGKVHNEIFPRRKIRWCDRYEYYMNDKVLVIERYINWKAKAYIVAIAPVAIILYGFLEYKEDFKSEFNQKKYGAFVSDTCFANRGEDNSYHKVKEYLEKNKNLG